MGKQSRQSFNFLGFTFYRGQQGLSLNGSIERRKGLDAMLADAKRGTFKVLVVMESSRIARDVLHLLNTLHELHQVGVRLVSTREDMSSMTRHFQNSVHRDSIANFIEFFGTIQATIDNKASFHSDACRNQCERQQNTKNRFLCFHAKSNQVAFM